jgi:hypothetical protein
MTAVDEWRAEADRQRREQHRQQAVADELATGVSQIRRIAPSTGVRRLYSYWQRQLDLIRQGPQSMGPARVEMRGAKQKPLERVAMIEGGPLPRDTKAWRIDRTSWLIESPDRPGDRRGLRTTDGYQRR